MPIFKTILGHEFRHHASRYGIAAVAQHRLKWLKVSLHASPTSISSRGRNSGLDTDDDDARRLRLEYSPRSHIGPLISPAGHSSNPVLASRVAAFNDMTLNAVGEEPKPSSDPRGPMLDMI